MGLDRPLSVRIDTVAYVDDGSDDTSGVLGGRYSARLTSPIGNSVGSRRESEGRRASVSRDIDPFMGPTMALRGGGVREQE